MPLLQGPDLAGAAAVDLRDPLGRRLCGCHGGDVRDLVLDGGFSQVAVVVNAFLAGRRVDDQLDIAVGDEVQDVRTSFVQLLDLYARNARVVDCPPGLAGGKDPESVFIQGLGDFRDFRLVLLIDRDQGSSLQRECGLGGLLCLEEGFAGGVRGPGRLPGTY